MKNIMKPLVVALFGISALTSCCPKYQMGDHGKCGCHASIQQHKDELLAKQQAAKQQAENCNSADKNLSQAPALVFGR